MAAEFKQQARAEYDAITDRINWSSLKNLRRSAAHYRHALKVPCKDSPALLLGRAVHTAVLEPAKFAAEYAVWDGGRRAGKEWEAFKAAHAAKDILTADEFSDCLQIQAAVRSSPVAAEYLAQGAAEVSALWTDEGSGLDCKARLDWVGRGAIVDLKTTRDASPTTFGREAYRLGYHCQAAFYQRGYAAAHGGARKPFVVIAVEKEPPFVVQVYELGEDVLQVGRDEIDGLLAALAHYREADTWPGYADTVMQLQLPSWAVGAEDDEDAAGLDLVVGDAA